MEIRSERTSSVIVHRVPAASADRFLEWQRGISQAAEGFPGYRGTDVYPPADRRDREWVAVIHFENPVALQDWLDSPARSEWVAKLSSEIRDFRLRTLPNGFNRWFVGLVDGPGDAPPSWKMALTVLLGLYPTVMILGLVVVPHTSPLGLALSMLIGNALSVSILQWAVMPALNVLLGPWLHASEARGKAFSAGGLGLVLLLLAGLAVVFRQMSG
jgi:antibiotic biosynthesis monooxygenase (ABM) superfamily enzyme